MEEPFPLGKGINPNLRLGRYSDVKVMGMEDMLEAAGPELTGGSHNMFVRGRTKYNDQLITVDLEHDSIGYEPELDMTVDIDSVVWTTVEPRVKASVELLMAPTVSRKAPIAKSNHLTASVLFPPTDRDRANNWHPWNMSSFSHSVIPHTRLARIGVFDILIAFPRMIHRNENTHRREANIPMRVLFVFWNRVLLPALLKHTPSSKHAYLGYTAEQHQVKAGGGKEGGSGIAHKGVYKPVTASEWLNTWQQVRYILASEGPVDEDLARFGSAYLIFEAKGIKLATQVPVTKDVDLFKQLEQEFSYLHWPTMLERKHGEVAMDIGVSMHPKREIGDDPLVGLWRLDALEASYGAGGFNQGTMHSLNTLVRYGGMNAQMSAERGRKTHVTYRLSYNLAYEPTRPKDNQPYLCDDGDAYSISEPWKVAFQKRIKTYQQASLQAYGVRDEYRVGGQAVVEILASLPERVSVEQLQSASVPGSDSQTCPSSSMPLWHQNQCCGSNQRSGLHSRAVACRRLPLHRLRFGARRRQTTVSLRVCSCTWHARSTVRLWMLHLTSAKHW